MKPERMESAKLVDEITSKTLTLLQEMNKEQMKKWLNVCEGAVIMLQVIKDREKAAG